MNIWYWIQLSVSPYASRGETWRETPRADRRSSHISAGWQGYTVRASCVGRAARRGPRCRARSRDTHAGDWRRRNADRTPKLVVSRVPNASVSILMEVLKSDGHGPRPRGPSSPQYYGADSSSDCLSQTVTIPPPAALRQHRAESDSEHHQTPPCTRALHAGSETDLTTCTFM